MQHGARMLGPYTGAHKHEAHMPGPYLGAAAPATAPYPGALTGSSSYPDATAEPTPHPIEAGSTAMQHGARMPGIYPRTPNTGAPGSTAPYLGAPASQLAPQAAVHFGTLTSATANAAIIAHAAAASADAVARLATATHQQQPRVQSHQQQQQQLQQEALAALSLSDGKKDAEVLRKALKGLG